MISLISVAHAATVNSAAKATAQGFVDKINGAILFPIIALLMAIAFIVFLYGAFIYVKNANNESAREVGRNHLIYGVIGMLIMLSAFAILNVAANTFGLSEELQNAQDTSSPFAPIASSLPDRRPVSATGGTVIPVAEPTDVAVTLPSEPTGNFEGPAGLGTIDVDIDEVPNLPARNDTYVRRTVPAQPLTPEQEENYRRYIDPYDVDIANVKASVLRAYQEYGVTEVVFMVPKPSLYTQNGGSDPEGVISQEVGSFDQQNALCERKGGSLVQELGKDGVTSINMYICLK